MTFMFNIFKGVNLGKHKDYYNQIILFDVAHRGSVVAFCTAYNSCKCVSIKSACHADYTAFVLYLYCKPFMFWMIPNQWMIQIPLPQTERAAYYSGV